MLHPIRVLDHVTASYRDYLTTEFRARDPNLRRALEEALDRPGFLAQEPYFSAHRPFPQDVRWCDLPLDPRLAEAIATRARSEYSFRHQSDAITYLLSPGAGPLVVTTGTGSGKTEAFLAPVLQAAIDDAVQQQRRPGLVAVLLYPMNALANDQKDRIDQYLAASGWSGSVDVRMYNRTTSEQERQEMRRRPPHVLLTNYQMLEYLLVRPKDREDLFANHRVRFLVLDEVHTYRGTLGTHVALLVRRLKAHLRRATPGARPPVCIGTSATIRSDDPAAPAEQAVQGFFGRLVGDWPETVRVIREAAVELEVPTEARYAGAPYSAMPDVEDPDAIRRAAAALCDAPEDTPLAEAARQCRLLWDLSGWLGAGPRSVTELGNLVRQKPERSGWDSSTIRREVIAALRVGAALPEGTPAALRLRAHRFVRGGWQFHRCLNPACGTLFPKGEAICSVCGTPTAPLYLCRACGADFWHLTGPTDGIGQLQPFPEVGPYDRTQSNGERPAEWLLYQPERWKEEEYEVDDEEPSVAEEEAEYDPTSRQRRPTGSTQTLAGSFDPVSQRFDGDSQVYPYPAWLSNSRTKCPGCGTTGGSRPIITRVSLGTSAAVKVLAEGLTEALPVDPASEDKKKRLLVFADSRQDAAHQARFVYFASRYDRMRQRVIRVLNDANQPLLLQSVVEALAQLAWEAKDNPHLPKVGRPRGEDKEKVQAWEEAPLLDDLAVNTRYRATLENLGLTAVRYHGLEGFIRQYSPELIAALQVSDAHLHYLVSQLLDHFRLGVTWAVCSCALSGSLAGFSARRAYRERSISASG